MSLPLITVTPAAAAQAYTRVDGGTDNGAGTEGGFGNALARALNDAVSVNKDAEAKSMQAISGNGSITDVVTAVSKADLALQTTVAIRDRVVQAACRSSASVEVVQEGDVGAMLRESMLVALKLGGPPLLVALSVGLVVSLVQAVTQINEQTLAFVPKVLAICGTLVVIGPFMMTTLRDFMQLLFDRVVAVGGS